jgi:3-oxoacyl-[acyl-carrier-protein] synthase-3
MNDMPCEIARSSPRRIDRGVNWSSAAANLSMLDALCKNLGIPAAKHLYNIDRFGNTSSAGWVTVLSEVLAEKRFASGDQLLVSVFGGGLAWGSLLARAA